MGLQGAPCKVNGETVEGYHVVLGGGVDDNGFIAQDVYQAVPFEDVQPLVVKMLSVYLEKREGKEDFASFTRKRSVEELIELFGTVEELKAV